MITDKVMEGNKIFLRQIEVSDCNENYVNWLNDLEVNQYLETKWSVQDVDSIKAFVTEQRRNNHSVLWAIIDRYDGKHIGNIKIGPIHLHYAHADVSYFIGEKAKWGGGLATEAIYLACLFGFQELNLHRIEAGAYDKAIGSWRALENNGFSREAVFRQQVLFHNEWIDCFRYGLLKTDFHLRGEEGNG